MSRLKAKEAKRKGKRGVEEKDNKEELKKKERKKGGKKKKEKIWKVECSRFIE